MGADCGAVSAGCVRIWPVGRRFAAVLWLFGSAVVASAATPARAKARAPRAAVADPALLESAGAVLAGASCRDRLLDELRTGTGTTGGCEGDRHRLARALVRREHLRFGYVERRDVELWAVQLVLGEAMRCRQWPLRSSGRAVLDPRDIEGAGCRGRRYAGPVEVALVGDDGRRAPLPALRSDADGRLRVVVSELEAAARSGGFGGLDRWRWVELGRGGWAGRIDLTRLQGFVTDWHLRWVKAGRGTPGLFAVAHPHHPGADDARALAVEAQVARQREDYAAVRAGRLSPRRFLARHPWSPFRREVEALATGGVPTRAAQPD